MTQPIHVRFFLCLIIVVGIISRSFCAETIIKGTISGFDEKELKAGVYKDYFTATKKWENNTIIKEGKFSLSLNLEETTQILLKIEDKETSLFAEPGKVYNIKLSYNKENNLGQSFNKLLELNFTYPQTGETNQLIKEFNEDYQDFLLKNYKKMLAKAGAKETNAFIEKWKSAQGFSQNKFVSNYVKYAIANLEDINKTPRSKLYNEYLENEPILSGHKEYVNFFTQFYKNDFSQIVLRKESKELLKAIMLENDLEKSKENIALIKNMSNIALAELYLMNGLFEVYHKKVINQKSSINILQQISEKGSTKNNKIIASSMVDALKQFEKPLIAADFNLKDTENKMHDLSSFEGKPIYLNFWSGSSIPSLRELRVIQKLEQKYGDKIHFVSINLDEGTASNKSVKEKYNYEWPFLHYGNDFKLREKYRIKTVPAYFLIDEKGNMLKAFAEGPTEIERKLHEMVR